MPSVACAHEKQKGITCGVEVGSWLARCRPIGAISTDFRYSTSAWSMHMPLESHPAPLPRHEVDEVMFALDDIVLADQGDE